ncbi:hypothetical protein EDD11_004905 [Mortierella claussenii]|nr:hypothetical protein EDD11_004905 [Mortierella claussenii]
MAVSAKILPVFEQLGLLKEFEKISLPCYTWAMFKPNMDLLGTFTLPGQKGTGYDVLIFERPKLYQLLMKQISPSRITLNKKVLRTQEKEERVFIHCADNTIYEGDVVIGADGAYSGVRQSMYKQLKEQGLLPLKDQEAISVCNVCMVGVADLNNPPFSTMRERFPQCTVVNVPGNRICWSTAIQLTDAEAKAQQFRNSEWGPETNESMIKEFENELFPWGGRLGEIMNATPKNLISKVFLEEKMFETWYHGRTVLIGDACHKMLPGAGEGAINAMQDAVVLANCIYKMTDTTLKSITAVFQEYHRQRYPYALASYQRSRLWSRVSYGQKWTERLLRTIMVKYAPHWVIYRSSIKNLASRPQVAWLPYIENRGTGHVLPQEGRRGQVRTRDTQKKGITVVNAAGF